jgi:hypothetical protein
VSRILIPSLLTILALAPWAAERASSASSSPTALAHPNPRAGIAIVGTGGASALDRVTVLDSATGQFIAVTRPACPDACAPLDSASGRIAPADVARLFALIETEQVFSLRDDYGVCAGCTERAAYATTVQANGRRKVITSDGEVTPLLLGRVHVALAEAIRSARGSD